MGSQLNTTVTIVGIVLILMEGTYAVVCTKQCITNALLWSNACDSNYHRYDEYRKCVEAIRVTCFKCVLECERDSTYKCKDYFNLI